MFVYRIHLSSSCACVCVCVCVCVLVFVCVCLCVCVCDICHSECKHQFIIICASIIMCVTPIHMRTLTHTYAECTHIQLRINSFILCYVSLSMLARLFFSYSLHSYLFVLSSLIRKCLFFVVYLPTPSTCRLSLTMLNCNQVS